MTRTLEPCAYFVDMLPRLALKRQVVKPYALAMVARRQMRVGGLEKAQISELRLRDVIHSVGPTVWFVAEQSAEWRPERYRALKPSDIDVDVMNHGLVRRPESGV